MIKELKQTETPEKQEIKEDDIVLTEYAIKLKNSIVTQRNELIRNLSEQAESIHKQAQSAVEDFYKSLVAQNGNPDLDYQPTEEGDILIAKEREEPSEEKLVEDHKEKAPK